MVHLPSVARRSVVIPHPTGTAVRPRARDTVRAYVALTKPRIIELLLVTTIPSMMLAANGWPGIRLVLATLLLVLLDRFETQRTDGGSLQRWDLSTWIGKSLKKLWIRTEGERTSGAGEHADLEVLWGKGFARWWELLAGARTLRGREVLELAVRPPERRSRAG